GLQVRRRVQVGDAEVGQVLRNGGRVVEAEVGPELDPVRGPHPFWPRDRGQILRVRAARTGSRHQYIRRNNTSERASTGTWSPAFHDRSPSSNGSSVLTSTSHRSPNRSSGTVNFSASKWALQNRR